MKSIWIAAMAAAALLTACEDKQNQPASGPQSTLGKVAESAKKTAAGVTARSEEAATEAAKITGETPPKKDQTTVSGAVDAARDAAFQAARKGVDALGMQIQDLRKRVAAAPESLRINAESTLNDLQERHTVLQKRLEDLRTASAERWRQVADEITQLTEKARRIAGDLARQLG